MPGWLRSFLASVGSNLVAWLIGLGLVALFGLLAVFARPGGEVVTIRVWMLLVAAPIAVGIVGWLATLTALVARLRRAGNNAPAPAQPPPGPHQALLSELRPLIQTLEEHDVQLPASWWIAESYNDLVGRAHAADDRVTLGRFPLATPNQYEKKPGRLADETFGDLRDRARRLEAVLSTPE